MEDGRPLMFAGGFKSWRRITNGCFNGSVDGLAVKINGVKGRKFGFGSLGKSIGQARKPGPAPFKRLINKAIGMSFLLEIANVTHLENFSHVVVKRGFDAMLITEHSAPQSTHVNISQNLGGMRFHLSGLDEEMTANVGGTGILIKGKGQVIKPSPKTPLMKAMLNKGRIGLYTFEVSKDNFVLCYIIYGYPNSEKDDEAASRTCDILAIAMQDAQEQDPGPILITGDLNGPLDRFPSLENAIQQGEWIDVGANASVNGGVQPIGTCRSSTPGARLNRRDYVIANDRALNLIESFEVDSNALLPVHAVIKVRFKGHRPDVAYDGVCLPHRLFNIVHDKVVSLYLQDNLDRAERKRVKDEDFKRDRRIHVNVNVPDQGLPPVFKARKECLMEEFMCDLSDDNLQVEAERLLDIDSSNITPSQWDTQVGILHGHMDTQLKLNDHRFDNLLKVKDTDGYMQLFSDLVENATLLYSGISVEDAKQYRGRSRVNIKKCHQGPGATFNKDTGNMEAPSCGEARRLMLQHRRLVTIRNATSKLSKGDTTPQALAQIRGNLRCFLRMCRRGTTAKTSLITLRRGSAILALICSPSPNTRNDFLRPLMRLKSLKIVKAGLNSRLS